MIGPGRLEVSSSERDGVAVVVIAGEVDMATAEAFRAALNGPPGAGDVVADLRGIGFMGSAGVRAIDDALRRFAAEGRRLRFVPEFSDSVRFLLTLTGLLENLPVTGAADGGGGT